MKNSKIKVGLVALLMSTGLLVGCNSGPNIGPEEKPHEHALVSIDAKDATYYKEGNIKYYYCPDCNKKFSDSTGTTEISDADIILKKKTILEETTEAQEEDVEAVLKQATVANGTKKFVSLEGGKVDTGLYVSHDKTGDYTTISLGLSEATDGIVAFEFDYRYLDNSNDREHDMLGHNYISTKVGGVSSFVPHTNGKLNKDCAWHTFSYHEDNNLGDGITAFEINIYHFDGELVINNVYVIHEVAGSTSTDPATVAHYEDLEGGVYYYDYDNDEYTYVGDEDVTKITKEAEKVEPTCENPGCQEYYYCEYTKEYYEDKGGTKPIEDIVAWKEPGGRGYIAPAHSLSEVPGQAATCTADGYKAAYKCSKCNKYYDDEQGLEVNLIGDENAYTTWKTTGAGKIAALDHKWLEAYESDGTHHWHVCERCGAPSEKVPHTFNLEVEDEKYIAGEASCTQPATYYKSCVCGEHGSETFTSGTPLGHNFDENGECTRCDENVKSYLGLEEASYADLVNKNTLSNLNIPNVDTTQWTNITGDHKVGDYDIALNYGINLTFQLKEDTVTTSGYREGMASIYLGSKVDESGLVIRLDYHADLKAIYGYIFNGSGGGTDLPAAGAEGTAIKTPDNTVTNPDNGIKVNICLTRVDANVNKYKIDVAINDVAITYTDGTAYDKVVTFNAEHLNDHKRIRFARTGTESSFKDVSVSDPHELVMLDGAGSVLGKKSDFTNPITLPELHKSNNKFVGWFDETGERLTTVSDVSKKTIAKPVFVESQNNMYVPSNFTWDTKGKELHPTGEQAYGNDKLPEGATRVDMYFIIRPTLVSADKFFYIGFPYDMTDGNNRVSIRVSLAPNSWYWDANKTTIGGEGAPGTAFNPSNSGLKWTSGTNYLFHVYIENTNIDATPFRLGFDVTNLADLTTYSSSKEFKFNTENGYTIGDKTRTKFGFRFFPGESDTQDFSVTDAW